MRIAFSEKSLVKQPLFWGSIVIPFLLFIFLGSFVWIGYDFEMSVRGYKKFLEISVLPLGFFSLSLPLSVLISRAHSSHLTEYQIKKVEEQIKITKEKNNIELFYKHRSELFDYFDRIGKFNINKKYIEIKLHPKLHSTFFSGKPSDGIPLMNNNKFEEIEEKLSQLLDSIQSVIVHKLPPDISKATKIMAKLKRLSIDTDSLIALTFKALLIDRYFVELIDSCKSPKYQGEMIFDNIKLFGLYLFLYDFFSELSIYAGYELKLSQPDISKTLKEIIKQ